MKNLKQLLIILTAYLLGIITQSALSLPIPGTVIGLVYLFLALCFKIVKVEMIEDICGLFTSNMAFLFIPAGVGLINSFDLIKGNIIGFIIIIIVSTIVLWLVTAYTVMFLRKGKSKNERDSE